MTDSLKLIKQMSESEVFEEWRKIEENLEHWKSFWKAKGYNSWEDWRKRHYEPILNKSLVWNLYNVSDPISEIPEWYGTTTPGWNKWFYSNFNEKPPRLKDLILHPGIHNHWYIREIINNFPEETIISGIRNGKGDISVVEGMHRVCAIVILAHEKKELDSNIKVILADWPEPDFPSLGTG